MNLYKNGFVVAEMNTENSAYKAWPLYGQQNDRIAESLTKQAYDIWFDEYDMQQIVPDLNYIKVYIDYCNSINLQAKVLLFESLDSKIVIHDEVEISEVLGFDCIATVDYSYLQEELDAFKMEAELMGKDIIPNKYGLLDKFEDILLFVELRKKIIASGVNLENFWGELPVRISVVNAYRFSSI